VKTKLVTTCFLLGTLMVPMAGYSADDADKDRSSPKAFVKDSVITTKIKAEMAKDKQVSAMHIKVDTDNNGVVQLSGKAKSRNEADKAVQIARNTKGVVAVEDHIQISNDR
jgi:hyperosmotically inducible protein